MFPDGLNSRPEPAPPIGAAPDVRSFYERHPYPPPIDSLDKYAAVWRDGQLRRADFRLFWPERAYRDDFSILVAGCGTSQAARHALRWPRARVTGIDFSATSIRHSEDLKSRYGLQNLQLQQLAIEQVEQLGGRFDQIICTGVLHHLPDPDLGLSALRRVLAPGGAMHLMVYAPYGRIGVYMLQAFCRQLGIEATEQGIGDLVVALRELPAGHPLAQLLRESPDFRHPAALADALLHPQDRAYSVPQFFDFVERAGLRFGRWLKQAPYSPSCGAQARIPQAARIAALTPAAGFAAVELFRGTMLRHSALVFGDGPPGNPQPINFDGDDWRAYVPIRLPDTICVQERLPPGAAAVLINRSHSHNDIYLPIDALAKNLFDAIDGRLTIGEIAARVGHADGARALFESLWQYDQVVFDASLQPGSDGAGGRGGLSCVFQ